MVGLVNGVDKADEINPCLYKELGFLGDGETGEGDKSGGDGKTKEGDNSGGDGDGDGRHPNDGGTEEADNGEKIDCNGESCF